jgi:hypothetical protein
MTNLAKAASILFGLTSAVSARSTPSAFVSGAKAFQSTSLNAAPDQKLPVMAEESIMAPKAHGSSEKAVMKDLKWDCDYNTADKICNFNRCVYSFIHIYMYLCETIMNDDLLLKMHSHDFRTLFNSFLLLPSNNPGIMQRVQDTGLPQNTLRK